MSVSALGASEDSQLFCERAEKKSDDFQGTLCGCIALIINLIRISKEKKIINSLSCFCGTISLLRLECIVFLLQILLLLWLAIAGLIEIFGDIMTKLRS